MPFDLVARSRNKSTHVSKLIMQVTTKNGIQARLKRNTIPEYADEFNRFSIANRMYKGEIIATSEKVALVYAEGREEKIIIAVDTNLLIVDCETIARSNEPLDDFCKAMSAIRERHGFDS